MRCSYTCGDIYYTCSNRVNVQRGSVVAGQQYFVGKETDRRWEFGEDLVLLRASKAKVYRPGMAVPDPALRQRVAAEGMRVLMRKSGLSQHTIEKILDGIPVRPATLQRVIAVLRE